MICQRCGTEYENEERICPRCYYGRPKVKKHLPKWVHAVVWPLLTLAVIGAVAWSMITHYNRSTWMEGAWEGEELTLTFDTEEDKFFLSNGDNVIFGTFVASKDSFTLTDENGKIYVYRFKRLGEKKIELSFTQGSKLERVELERVENEFVGEFEE